MPKSPVLLVLLLASCASASPTLYTLDSRPGVTRTGGPRLVVVRSFGVPRYLERQEVVHSAGPGLLVASDNDWWGEPLGVMLRRVMVDDVAQRLPNSDVLAGGGSIASHPDAEVQIDLQRFERDGTEQVTLVGYVAIDIGSQPRSIDRLRISVPVTGATTRDQVGAMSTALAQAADIVASRLAQQNGQP